MGKGGGGETERQAPQESKRELERRRRHAFPGVACRRVEGLQTIAGGSVTFAPPPTPKPSTTSRTGRGGCKPALGRVTGNQERTLVGRQPVGCRFPTDGRQRTRRCWRGAAKYTDMGGEEAKRTKVERRRERCPGGQEPG